MGGVHKQGQVFYIVFQRCMIQMQTSSTLARKVCRRVQAAPFRQGAQGAIRTGQGGALAPRSERSAVVFKRWPKFYLTSCCARLGTRIRAVANLWSFLTAGKMR